MLTLATVLFSSVVLTLPPEARVRGTEMTLGEVARVQGSDPAQVETLSALSLGYAPAPGYHRVLSRQQIGQWLHALRPELEFVLDGSHLCRVRPATETVPAEVILDTAREELERLFGDQEVILEPEQPLEGLEIPMGDAPFQLKAGKVRSALKPGAVAMPVRIEVDGQIYRTLWTNWRAELWQSLPVLVRDVAAGEPITAELMAVRRIKVTSRQGAEPLESGKLLGAVAARALEAGSTVTQKDVVRPVLVRRGDSLLLVARSRNIVARKSAVALSDGARGDRIRIRADGSDKEMTAVVIGRDVAEINLTPSQQRVSR